MERHVPAMLGVAGLWAGWLGGLGGLVAQVSPVAAQVAQVAQVAPTVPPRAPLAAGVAPAGPCWVNAPGSRPTFGPYLNLIRGGNAAVNYYGLVRPITQLQRAVEELGERGERGAESKPAEKGSAQRGHGVALPPLPTHPAGLRGDSRGAGLPVTGHAVGFQGQWRYFQHFGGGGTARGDAATPRLPGTALGPLGNLGSCGPGRP